MALKPPSLGGFDVVELLGAVRTPASLVRTSKDGCPLCPAGGEKPISPSPLPPLPPAWRTGLFVFLFLLLRMSSWPQLTHHSFREAWGRKQGLLGWGLFPRAPGGFQSRAKGDIWVRCSLCEHLKPIALPKLKRSTSLPLRSLSGPCLLAQMRRPLSFCKSSPLPLSDQVRCKASRSFGGTRDVSHRPVSLQVTHAVAGMP